MGGKEGGLRWGRHPDLISSLTAWWRTSFSFFSLAFLLFLLLLMFMDSYIKYIPFIFFYYYISSCRRFLFRFRIIYFYAYFFILEFPFLLLLSTNTVRDIFPLFVSIVIQTFPPPGTTLSPPPPLSRPFPLHPVSHPQLYLWNRMPPCWLPLQNPRSIYIYV